MINSPRIDYAHSVVSNKAHRTEDAGFGTRIPST